MAGEKGKRRAEPADEYNQPFNSSGVLGWLPMRHGWSAKASPP
jgi:hypothetical protein